MPPQEENNWHPSWRDLFYPVVRKQQQNIRRLHPRIKWDQEQPEWIDQELPITLLSFGEGLAEENNDSVSHSYV